MIIPNPVNATAVIHLENLSVSGEFLISMYDIHGKNVMEVESNYSEISHGILINMEKLKKGMYLLKIISAGRIYSGRLEKL